MVFRPPLTFFCAGCLPSLSAICENHHMRDEVWNGGKLETTGMGLTHLQLHLVGGHQALEFTAQSWHNTHVCHLRVGYGEAPLARKGIRQPIGSWPSWPVWGWTCVLSQNPIEHMYHQAKPLSKTL